MNLNKIFSTESAKNEAIEHFRGLKDDPDWLFLVEKMIKADIEEISEEILDPNKEWKAGEEREKKKIRAYWIILSQLPEKLIEPRLLHSIERINAGHRLRPFDRFPQPLAI